MESILIANRGEIALRILRTSREMGLFTVAVYSDADADTPAVRQAHLAVRLGAAPPAESYLNMERVLAAAQGNGVDAIHPGYGFLSENAAFSAACAERGIAFIGPPPQVIRAMGDKAQAKRLMQKAGVPVVPGYEGKKQDDATLRREAKKLGFPLLVKAVAGGGGRGIRLVEGAKALGEALASARREAAAGFGDGRLMLEKFLQATRHVEFQIMADSHGNVLHLFERECSIQRRHQKVIEETPSPALGPRLREAMGEAAVRAARAIGYVGAGTVEFLLDAEGGFYFLEMNTRLQVEHPITEMTLGLDMVRMQIEVAQGLPLPMTQEALAPSGHAIECRLNAEDPARGFLPAVGRLARFSFPAGPGLRVDAGYGEGAEIGSHYDSLLAKLVAWAPTRGEARRKMARMLAESMVAGVDTNLAFLQAVLEREEFRAGDYGTGLVERHEQELVTPARPRGVVRELLLAAAAVDALLETERPAPGGDNGAPRSPWQAQGPWAAAAGTTAAFRRDYGLDGVTHAVEVRPVPNGAGELALRMSWEGATHHAACIPTAPGEAVLDLGEARLPLRWGAQGEVRWIALRGTHARITSHNPHHEPAAGEAAEAGLQKLLAPLPGTVIKVLVKRGQRVKADDLLLIMEAVKMEHSITAPFPGKVGAIHFRAGDPVNKDELLLDLEPE